MRKIKDLFFSLASRIVEAEQCSCPLSSLSLDSCRRLAKLREEKKDSSEVLGQYCNKKTCSQKVFAKIFIES